MAQCAGRRGDGRRQLTAKRRTPLGVKIVLGIVAIFIALFMLSDAAHYIEREHDPRGPSWSAAEAEKAGTLVRRLTVTSGALPTKSDSVTIREAWIERRSRVRALFFVFPHREALPGTVIAVAPPSREPATDFMFSGLRLHDDGGAAEWFGRSSGTQLVFWRDVSEPLPESLALHVCEYKFNRDGRPERGTHVSLVACPQPWLDSLR